MMEDNKIAIFRLVAGEKVEKNIEHAKSIEDGADGDAPHTCPEVLVKCKHEWDEKKQYVKHECHERVPVKTRKHMICVPKNEKREKNWKIYETLT